MGSPRGPGELLLVELKFLVHPPPQRPRAAAADRPAVEHGNGLDFACGSGNPQLIGGAQLCLADRLYAAVDRGASREQLEALVAELKACEGVLMLL